MPNEARVPNELGMTPSLGHDNVKTHTDPQQKNAFHRDSVCTMACVVLPDGDGGFTPCPELLTQDEAIRYLRLDAICVEDPTTSLRYYRKKGLLRATQVGKSIRYRRIELDRFLERLTENNPR